jgi:hypothetical protein
VADGTTANFAVAATGDAPLAYQWRRNGADLVDGAGVAGATTATLALVAPYAFNASQLSVRVSNAAGNVLSGNALLSVTPIAPTISSQPANVSVGVGAPASFSVATTGGTAPVTYQWRRDGVVIGGATAATYTLAAAAAGDNGAAFSVDVVNPAGTLASTAGLLSVAAAGKAWGAAALISTGDTLNSPGYPQVVIDSAGNAITVWQEETPGAVRRNAVWARRYLAGAAWSVAATIDQGVGNAVQPQIAITPAGIAVATFMQSTANNGGGSQIMANRFSGTWGAAQRRDADAFGRATYSYVSLAADGAATVVFTQPGNTAARVWASQSSAPGVWAAPVALGGEPAFQPQVATAANGHAIMTWLEPNSTGPYARSLWASRDIGAGWTPPVAIAAVASGVTPIRVVADANGNAIAVWQQELGGRTAIRANRLDAASGVWGTALTLNDASVHGGDPEPAMDANGNAIVVWSAANDAGAGNGVANLGITARRFVAATGSWSSAVTVQPNPPQPQGAPHVAVDAAGNAIAVWLQGSPTSGTQSEVWGAHFNAAAAAWGAPLKLMTDPAAYAGGGTDQRPKVAINANGEAVVVWYQRTDAPASVGIWARVYR